MSYFMIAAAVVTLVAGAAQANQQRQAGKANQQISNNNAKLADQQAHDEMMLGAQQSEKSVWRMRATQGAQRAAMAASGVDSGVGTASDLQDETALYGAADINNIGIDSARRAWGFDAEANNYRNQGAQARWMGNSSSNITILSSIGQSLGYGASAYGNYKAGGTSSPRASTSSNPYGGGYTPKTIGPYS